MPVRTVSLLPKTPTGAKFSSQQYRGLRTVIEGQMESHYRQWLHNFIGKRQLGTLAWELDDKIVYPHGSNHFWTAKVKLNGRIYGQGTGWRKSDAQENAAQQALAALQQEYD